MQSKIVKRKSSNDIEILKGDFVAFLHVLWHALNLPKPTRCQIDMARTLERGTHKKFILMAFRGIGKSFISCAFVVWSLWNNPQLKVLIVSASKERADANSIFIKNIINLLPFLWELKPKDTQRNSVLSFDVGPATPDHSPSVKSVGITGQLTGSRADIIIADDIEVPNNSATEAARNKLWQLVTEFAALLKPTEESRVIYLGTPQTEQSVYTELENNRGYSTLIWPALYPRNSNEALYYGDRLAPMLRRDYNENTELLEGTPTDPLRFNKEELLLRELEYGKAGFTMQFQLNPNISDQERFPLRLRNLIVAPVDPDKAPLSYQWLPNNENQLKTVPNVGLKGDSIHSFHSASGNTAPYQSRIMMIDPSGRGQDETAYAVLFSLNGYIYLMDTGGFSGGYDDTTLEGLARIARKWKVQKVIHESNFGDGLFGKVFSPILLKHHQCILEEIKSSSRKELRICDTLEPIMGTHRLVVRDEVVREDYQSARNKDGKMDITYSLFYQLTRVSREKGCLRHDDRLDALALAVNVLREVALVNSKVTQDEILAEFLENHMEEAMKVTPMGTMRVGNVDIMYDLEDGADGNFLMVT